jgi:hypothetical protein
MQHVHGQVALSLAAGRLLPVLMLALQLSHPQTVLQPGVVTYTLDPKLLPSLLHKVMPVEKLKGQTSTQPT